MAGTADDQLKSKLTLDYEFLGAKTVKNIPEPVRTYRVRMEPPQSEVAPTEPELAPARRASWIQLVAAAGLVAVVVVVGLWHFSGRTPRVQPYPFTEPKRASIQCQSLCLSVLPFTQSKGGHSDQDLGDGLSAEVNGTAG
ncbi:MAG: hypothetical protein HY912_09510 [Desulfomonile tiedjei]|uniref:Uncharacterized protein n=1 Tax=Desulfomonile tiedjei TaxID=2358 RepID=A0A9D6Z3D0_9BACT|nr:hypothetical protein [Desulfomonile tiedjei]